MADVRSNLYGSSVLYDQTTFDISPVFNPAGCAGIPLGHNPDDRSKGLVYDLGPNGHPGHALTFGSTRSGKGVNTIIPALLTTLSSCVVIDPKGENAWVTAQRRRALGQRVVILDPWDEVNKRYGSKVGVTEHVTKFNPLSALDPRSPDFADDVAAIAEAFIIQSGNDPHWPDSARELTAGLIAAECEKNPGEASMGDVRKLLRAPIDKLKEAIKLVTERDSNSVAAAKLAAFNEVGSGTKEISSIRSTARTQTGFLDSSRLLDAMETDEQPFDLAELGTGNITLYLVLPVDRLKTHGRWLRMILTLAIRAIARQATAPPLPVLFILDEMGTIGALSMIEQSYGLMAGLGIRIWGFLQDLPQLKRDYPLSWETFVSNSSIVQLLNCGDETTAAYVSHYLGNSTVEVNRGWAPHTRPSAAMLERRKGNPNAIGGVEAGLRSAAAALAAGGSPVMNANNDRTEMWEPDLAFHSRPILFPWEVRTQPSSSSIIMVPGQYNLRLQRFTYYSDPVFSKWARPDPSKPVYEPPAAPAKLRFDTQTGKPITDTQPPPEPTPAEKAAAAAAAQAGKAASAVGGWLKNKIGDNK